MQAAYEMADVLEAHWPAIRQGRFNTWQLRTMDAVRRCRTASLGGHIDGCSSCGLLHISYNSCRNRHCPKCQGKQREEWIQAREEELLPVPYFHVVFTLPDTLNQLCMHKPAVLYNLLFKTAWSVIDTFGKDHKWLGAQAGMIAILHTWGQTLTLHPHLHCIVPGGGLTKAGKWKMARSKGKYLFDVKAMSVTFRGKFMAALKEQLPEEMTSQLVNALYKHKWVVYAKRPFTGPQSVVEYLGRYTHKIAISNHRIKNINDDKVTFSYKDYRHGSVKKEMVLDAFEFIRRYSLHILPRGLVRIRHYGILSSTTKKQASVCIKEQLPQAAPACVSTRPATQPFNPKECPCCKKETLHRLMHFNYRGPPQKCMEVAADILYAMI
jgi:Putative transposase/Transposase zinc-binding domain